MECPVCLRQECPLCPQCHTRCGQCHHCRDAPIPKQNRKYCSQRSPIAAGIWKSRFRNECRRKGFSYKQGDPEKTRSYQREYMRRWRAKRKRALQ